MEQLWKKEFPHCGAIVEFVGIPQLTHSFNKVWNTLIFSSGTGCLGIGPGFETQVNGRVSQMGGGGGGGLGLKVFPSTSMDASNDGLSMVGTPDSA